MGNPETDVAVIYIAYCRPSGKAYVGQSIHFQERKQTHLGSSKLGSNKHAKFYNALRFHGENSFSWSVILCPDQTKLTEWEFYWYEKLDSIKNGYNCYKPGQEYDGRLRRKLSIASTGKKHSPETIAKMSGRRCAEETRVKISAANRGKKRTPEEKANMKAARQRRHHPEATPCP